MMRQKAMAAVLPAVLSGAAMVFVDKFKYSPALGCYPLGLIAALMWAYIDAAVGNLRSERRSDNLIGWAHVATAFAVTVGAAAFAIGPAIKQLDAEWNIERADRIVALQETRRRAVSVEVTTSRAASPEKSPAIADAAS
jgi:hypothetical protein